ncbi:MAG: response regulator [Helicobacteraceae bacterium]|jgi:two-component system chemotaxis response regulator CheB|nr:response regulator [Helicobacteraceae bacterium]
MIRILVVEDSLTAREVIKDFLSYDSEFVVVGEAADGKEGVRLARELSPNLVTMDLAMPYSLEAIETITKERIAPVAVVSSYETPQNIYETATRGALDFFRKEDLSVKASYKKRLKVLESLKRIASFYSAHQQCAPHPKFVQSRRILAVTIGISTGGPKALQELLSNMRPIVQPIFIVQHKSDGMDADFANWLGSFAKMPVKTAQHNESYQGGTIYIAPSGLHLTIDATHIILEDSDLVQHQKPAADVLFKSAAKALGEGVLAVVMTGMGFDGADGAFAVKNAGGIVIAQDESTSLIFGMPKAVIERGAADFVLPLGEIGAKISFLCMDRL